MTSRNYIYFLALLLLAPSAALADGGPAVSGPSGKLSVEGGQYDSEGSALALGSFTMPLGYSFGVQADGAVGAIDDETMGGAGLHLFTRDPSKYLLGVYGSYHKWNSIEVWRTAAEFELYLGRVSLTGLAGYESVDVPTISRGFPVINKQSDHFFGYADLAYYATDDFRIAGGYRYVSETSLGSVSGEYLFRRSGVPISLFAQGEFGDNEYNRVTGGLKVYFGADPGKSLIERHRTEDPQNYTPVFPQILTQQTPNGETEQEEELDDFEELQ